MKYGEIYYILWLHCCTYLNVSRETGHSNVA